MPSLRARLPFTKMHGVGNDLIVVDGRTRPGIEWSGLAIEMCDRRTGVGADGLLVIDHSRIADFAMRMYNPDGSPDFCGNGLRCVARYVSDRCGPAPPGPHVEMTVATLAGVRAVTVRPGNPAHRVTVQMGEPRFAPEQIPALAGQDRMVDYPLELEGETLRVTSLSTGSTHTVVFVESLPEDERFVALSTAIENHPTFPARTSVMWTQVLTPTRLRLRIWERGVGETWGCGSGACAAMVAARVAGYVEQSVVVASRGGELLVEWSEGEQIWMTGPAEYAYEGVYRLEE